MPVAASPPTPPQPRRPSGRPSRRGRAVASPLRPTAVAGLALLLALASLREPVGDGEAGRAAATPAGVDGLEATAPPEWGRTAPPAGPAVADSPVAAGEGPVLRPAAAVAGPDSAAPTADGAWPDGKEDAHEVAIRLALRLGAGIAGQLPGVIVADPFGAARAMPHRAPPALDSTMSLGGQEP